MIGADRITRGILIGGSLGAFSAIFGFTESMFLSIGVGMIPLVAPNFRQWMPHSIHPLIESGILLSSLAAVALNVFFNGAKHDGRAAIEAAKQAEAH